MLHIAAIALALALLPGAAFAQFNPLTAIGRVVSTSMDVRSKSEVAADAEIATGASSRVLEKKGAEWTGVTILVFQQHVVLAGAVKTSEAKRIVEDVVKTDKRIRSLKNELRTGDVGSLVKDTALEAEINATLTAASGVSSVNMRWSSVGGQVVLMGVAQSKEESSLAVSKVRGVKGVKGVKPHLRVVAPKK